MLLDLFDTVEGVDFSVVDLDDCARCDHAQTVHHSDSQSGFITPLELHLTSVVPEHELLLDFEHFEDNVEIPLRFLDLVDLYGGEIVVPHPFVLIHSFVSGVPVPPLSFLKRIAVLLHDWLTEFVAGRSLWFFIVFEAGEALADLLVKYVFFFLHEGVDESSDLCRLRVSGFVDFLHDEGDVFAAESVEVVRVGQLEDVEYSLVAGNIEGIHQSFFDDFVVEFSA